MTDERQDMNAAEYVLGTLRGAERDRFESAMRESQQLRQAVSEWEARFAQLNEVVPPVTPPPQVWKSVEQRLGFIPPTKASSSSFWRPLALLTSAASLLLVAVLTLDLFAPRVPVVAESVAVVVRSQQEVPLWLVRVDWATGSVAVESLVSTPAGAGRDHELWLLGGAEEPPLSLGLLPEQGAVSLSVAELAERRPTASAVAVSLEPTGGSPTGQPTGPVLFSAAFDLKRTI